VGELLDALEAHQNHLQSSGELDERRAERFEREMELFAYGMVRAQLQRWREDGRLAATVCDIQEGSLDPSAAARALIKDL
jgi:LAO/AO transport system kinase